MLSNKDAHSIKVANMSLGKGIEESNEIDPLVLAAEALWDSGVVVVCSAGNYGRDGHFTITSPGNSRKVITVGSITDAGTGNDLTDDFVSTYSSRGPTLHDHILKPDLLAPGNRVVAPIPEVAGLRTDLADRVVLLAEGLGHHLQGLPVQGFGLHRRQFEAIGGFRAMPLMEDIELADRCRRIGAVRRLPLEVRTTARRFQRHPVRTRLMTASFPARSSSCPCRISGCLLFWWSTNRRCRTGFCMWSVPTRPMS